MLLATWYKRALKESILGQLYADRGKVRGVDQDPKNNQEIYGKYVEAFKRGVFNMIKEDTDMYTQEVIPRKYFSGGTVNGYPKVLQVLTRAKAPEAGIKVQVEVKGLELDLAAIRLENAPAIAQGVTRQGPAEDDLVKGQLADKGIKLVSVSSGIIRVNVPGFKGQQAQAEALIKEALPGRRIANVEVMGTDNISFTIDASMSNAEMSEAQVNIMLDSFIKATEGIYRDTGMGKDREFLADQYLKNAETFIVGQKKLSAQERNELLAKNKKYQVIKGVVENLQGRLTAEAPSNLSPVMVQQLVAKGWQVRQDEGYYIASLPRTVVSDARNRGEDVLANGKINFLQEDWVKRKVTEATGVAPENILVVSTIIRQVGEGVDVKLFIDRAALNTGSNLDRFLSKVTQRLSGVLSFLQQALKLRPGRRSERV